MVNGFDGAVYPETTRTEKALPTTSPPLDSATITPPAQSKVPLSIRSSAKRIEDHQLISAPISIPHDRRALAVAFETPVRAASLLGTGLGIGEVPPNTVHRTVGGGTREARTTRVIYSDDRRPRGAEGNGRLRPRECP